jgi:amino-acid N-acetyltransferase
MADEITIGPATEGEIDAIVALNNMYAPDGLTLQRTRAWVADRVPNYNLARTADGKVVGCVAIDEYSPSLAELVSLAVAPEAQGRGLGGQLVEAAVDLARRRGYDELFAVSLADTLFLSWGFHETRVDRFPEKRWRYLQVSRSELSIAKKFCFSRELAHEAKPKVPRRRKPSRRKRPA